jgi:hypothetical protein
MSNQKKLDIATLIIILISITLILAGFYLLNKSYTKNNKDFATNSQSSSFTTFNSTTKENPKSESSLQSFSSMVSNISSTVSVISSTSSSQESSTQSSASSVMSKSKLSETEAVIKIESNQYGNYIAEVLDTGYVNGKLWKTGSKLKISLTDFVAQVGKEYKLTGISEKGNYTNFDLIQDNK